MNAEAPAIKQKRKKDGFIQEITGKRRALYLMMLPGLVSVILFSYVPMYGIVIAWKSYYPWYGIWESPWVGWKNFNEFISSPWLFTILRNSTAISLMKLAVNIPAPMILALMLNEIRSRKFKRAAQTITYLPHFLSWVIIYGIFFFIFNESYGAFNNLRVMLGFERISFLTRKSIFWQVLTLSSTWRSIGWGSIIYLAAISGINPELYESAVIDSASKWQQTIYITIPQLLPVFAIMMILALGNILNGDFEQIFMFMGGVENTFMQDVGEVFETHVYRTGLFNVRDGLTRYSYAATVDIFKNFFGLFLVVMANSFAKRKLNYRGVF